jgi:hypothetical protein
MEWGVLLLSMRHAIRFLSLLDFILIIAEVGSGRKKKSAPPL